MTEGVQHKPTHDALQYLLNHQDALQRYCEDGRLPMTNIQAEHVAKSIALARKYLLFADTPAGAKASAMTYSLLETARANGHTPFEYLNVLLNEIANSDSLEQVEQLLPWNLTVEQVERSLKPILHHSSPILATFYGMCG